MNIDNRDLSIDIGSKQKLSIDIYENILSIFLFKISSLRLSVSIFQFRNLLNYPATLVRWFFFSALPEQGPIITGSRLRYQIGDRVQVNCTSGRSRPATKLAWYINGEPAPSPLVQPATHEKFEDGLERTSLALDFKVKPKHFRKGDLKLKVSIENKIIRIFQNGTARVCLIFC